MDVLLLWHEVAENLQIFLISGDDVTPEFEKQLKSIHGSYWGMGGTTKEMEDIFQSVYDFTKSDEGRKRKVYDESSECGTMAPKLISSFRGMLIVTGQMP